MQNYHYTYTVYMTNLARVLFLLLWPFILAYHCSDGKTANKLCRVTIPIIRFHTREARVQAY